MRISIIIIFAAILLNGCTNTTLTIKTGSINGSYTLSEDGTRTIISSENTLQDSSNFVWGASVIKGDDGRFHMFYARWDTGPDNLSFSNAWVLYSEIAYAVSDFPDRNFQYVATVLRGRLYEGDSTAWDAQAVHNPHIKKFDGKYYLYYIGNMDPGPQPESTPGWALNKRNRCQQNQYTGVVIFDSIDKLLNGEFSRSKTPLLLPRTRVRADKKNILFPSPEGTIAKPDNIIIVNPSVVFRESDEKYLLYFKGNLYDPHWKGIHGVAIANSPEGPFIALDDFVFDIKTKDGSIVSAEDPYVWYHNKYKCFYAIIKDFSGKITSSDPGLAILRSDDGIAWSKPNGTNMIKKELRFKDGSTLKVNNLERPQLLLDKNGKPLVLYAACSIEAVGNKKDGTTFNIQIPLE